MAEKKKAAPKAGDQDKIKKSGTSPDGPSTAAVTDEQRAELLRFLDEMESKGSKNPPKGKA